MNTQLNPFAPATKEKSKLRLALCGPAGSGKTWTALRIAGLMLGGEAYGDDALSVSLARRDNGLARIAFIDTERGSARKYSDNFPSNVDGQAMFDVLELQRNDQGAVDAEDMTDAIIAAGVAGYEFVIVDSLSHAWEGVLDLKDKKDRQGGVKGSNSYTNWRDVTPVHNRLVDAMLDSPCHIIASMRVKMEHVIEKDENNRTTIRKVGLKPVQRDGVDHEFDIVFDMADINGINTALITKTRCSGLKKLVAIQNPGVEVAATVGEWLATGVEVVKPMNREEFIQEMGQLGFTTTESIAEALKKYGMAGAGGARKYNLMVEGVVAAMQESV